MIRRYAEELLFDGSVLPGYSDLLGRHMRTCTVSIKRKQERRWRRFTKDAVSEQNHTTLYSLWCLSVGCDHVRVLVRSHHVVARRHRGVPSAADHPVHLAEQAALLDHLSGKRFCQGVGEIALAKVS